jgi:Flp pilus assembly protein CpaB
LLVNPADAEKLTFASADGKIHLALRNGVDLADVNPPPVYGSSIFLGTAPVAAAAAHGVVAKPAPVPPPYNVQVIRGDKVENQSFPQ